MAANEEILLLSTLKGLLKLSLALVDEFSVFIIEIGINIQETIAVRACVFERARKLLFVNIGEVFAF